MEGREREREIKWSSSTIQKNPFRGSEKMVRYSEVNSDVLSVTFDHDAKIIAAGFYDGSIKLINSNNGKLN